MATVHRISMLKVPNISDVDVLGALYARLLEEAVKVRPSWPLPCLWPCAYRAETLQGERRYISEVSCGRLSGDMCSKGYTFAVCTKFASLADMEYYVTECTAHKRIQVAAKDMVKGVSSSWFYGEAETGQDA